MASKVERCMEGRVIFRIFGCHKLRKEAKTVSVYWPLWPLSEMFCHAPLALESIGIFHNVIVYPLSLADVSICCSLERSLALPVFYHFVLYQ
jgi:hypothetical protein